MARVQFLCDAYNPSGEPRVVGEIWTDGAGNWFTRSIRRTGKGSSRAQQTGGRLVEQGLSLQIRWSGSAAASFDAVMERLTWDKYRSKIGDSLPDDRLIGSYRCPEGHWVGTTDTDELIDWADRAMQLDVQAMPLPPISMSAVSMEPV